MQFADYPPFPAHRPTQAELDAYDQCKAMLAKFTGDVIVRDAAALHSELRRELPGLPALFCHDEIVVTLPEEGRKRVFERLCLTVLKDRSPRAPAPFRYDVVMAQSWLLPKGQKETP